MVMDDTTRFTVYPLRTAADDPTPAYPGARFNSAGYCTNHSNVRLCTVTDEGKYKIMRKVCFKCGSSALRSQNSSRVNTLHGCAKKEVRSRELPKDMLSATATTLDGGNGGADSTNARANNTTSTTTGEAEKELRRKKTRDATKKKSKKSKKKDRKSLRNSSTENAAATSSSQLELRRKLERKRSTRRSRSRSLSTTTSRTHTVTSLSLSELSERYPPPPRSLSRSRSKSRNRKATTATAAKKDFFNEIKPMRRNSTLVNISSSESVEAKVKEITKSNTTKADYYAELGKLITTSSSKDEDNTTLPTLSSCCPSTPESFKSKEAIFSYDKAGLIVELYKKEDESNELDQNKKSSGSRERKGVLRRMPKLKPRYSTNRRGE